jgi:hypothetical protein
MIVVLVQCETCNVRAPAEAVEDDSGISFYFPASWFFSGAFGHFCTHHCALTCSKWGPTVSNEEREGRIKMWEKGTLP